MRYLVFLFTDIEGSTRLWETFPQDMYEVLRKHDRVVRNAITAKGGQVFRTVGDAFYATFEKAADAFLAAIDIQVALSTEDWAPVGQVRVRIGIHAGEAEPRDGDYYGPELNRVHRLLSAGHGGQILCSSSVANHAVHGVSLQDLGVHRLKDLSAPFQVYQLVHESLPSEFPRLRTLDPVRTNLPHQPTSFVGRTRELEELTTLVQRQRLVTLCGAGGCGKTRLAYQTASELLDEFDGIWVGELASLTPYSSLAFSLAHALGENVGLGEDPDDRVIASLADSHSLIILDNCEHLLDSVASLVWRLLSECPTVHVLVTSREPLSIPAETVMRVPSLEASSDGVALFFERSGCDESHRAAAERIVERLDGIPLAIELAAARTAFQSPEEILEGLEDRFALLTSGNRGALPRHRTLYESINWSYQLLSDEERDALQQFATFADGAEVELVAALMGRSVSSTRILLTGLCEKSFMFRQEGRYRLLESVAAFGLKALEDCGREGETLSRCASVLTDRALHLEMMAKTEQSAALDLMDRELPNFRRAFAHLAIDQALRLASSLSLLWEFRGHWRAGSARAWHVVSTLG